MNKHSYILVILFGLLCIPLVSLLSVGFPLTHDGPDHVARIANFFASLAEGNIVPRWASNLNWGYGHPILMFLYPLSSYMASLFIFLGFSLIDSTKLVFAVTFILSGLSMYLWAGKAWGKRAGFISALLYTFAPYRFVDLYVRGAIGEHVAFIFPPLIAYALMNLSLTFEGKNSYITKKRLIHTLLAALSVGALILSHNALALMFLPIIGFYTIYLFLKEGKKNTVFFVFCGLSVLLGLGLSSFFWIPAFFEGKYTLRDIVTQGTAVERFVLWGDFIKVFSWNYGQTDTLSKSIGLSQILGTMTAGWVLVMNKVNRKERILLISSIILFVTALFIQTAESTFVWRAVHILQTFQFPWRFLSVVVFLTSVIGGVSFSILTRRIGKHWSLIVLTLAILLSTMFMWQPKGFSDRPDSYYSGIYDSTTDTGESSPIWSIRFMEHRPAGPMDIAEGQIHISPVSRTTTTRRYEIEAAGPGRLVENTLYFPGWNVFVDGVETEIQFQDPLYRGLITFRVTEGKHDVSIKFADTKVRTLSNFISVMSLAGVIGIFIGAFVWKKKRT